MARYTVHIPEGENALEHSAFVRDGFSFPAFFAGPFWLIAKGAWIAGFLALAAMTGLLIGIAALGASAGIVFAAFVLIALLLGFEGASLRRWELTRRGWREAGLVVGADRDTLERRFFEQALQTLPGEPIPVQPVKTVPHATPSPPQVLGLFPDAGIRR